MNFRTPQQEVDALLLFAAEHPNWRLAALNAAAKLQLFIFAHVRQLYFEFAST